MHHEFAHILHQKRNFDPSFNRISEGKYVGADWYYYMTAEGAMPRTNDIAWPDGFVTAYAMNQANEDFVENIAMYVTHTQTYWDNMLRAAGETGAATINKKVCYCLQLYAGYLGNRPQRTAQNRTASSAGNYRN